MKTFVNSKVYLLFFIVNKKYTISFRFTIIYSRFPQFQSQNFKYTHNFKSSHTHNRSNHTNTRRNRTGVVISGAESCFTHLSRTGVYKNTSKACVMMPVDMAGVLRRGIILFLSYMWLVEKRISRNPSTEDGNWLSPLYSLVLGGCCCWS